MSSEFENLLQYINSLNASNVRLGLELAKNHQKHFKNHFGVNADTYSKLFEFAIKHGSCEFEEPFNIHLEDLYLSNKEITILPKEIGRLAKLVHINLCRNQINVLPQEIGKLQNLCRLDLYHNKLVTIPKEIGNLENLQMLDLSHNQIQELPEEIGKLKRLRILKIESNQLTNLSKVIVQCSSLEDLYLANNNISSKEIEHIKEKLPECSILVEPDPHSFY